MAFFTMLLFVVLDNEAVQLLKSYQNTDQSEICLQSHWHGLLQTTHCPTKDSILQKLDIFHIYIQYGSWTTTASHVLSVSWQIFS